LGGGGGLMILVGYWAPHPAAPAPAAPHDPPSAP